MFLNSDFLNHGYSKAELSDILALKAILTNGYIPVDLFPSHPESADLIQYINRSGEFTDVQTTIDELLEHVANRFNIITQYPTQANIITYDGNEHSVEWYNYDSTLLDISGELTGINAGEYKVYFTPKEGYCWLDASAESKEITWKIDKLKIIEPSVINNMNYNGLVQTPIWDNYDINNMLMSGDTSGINSNEYITKFTLKDPINHSWYSTDTSDINISWNINIATISIPVQKKCLSYNSYEQIPEWDNYNSSLVNISGITKATNIGVYTAVFSLKDVSNTLWYDMSESDKNVQWSIDNSEIDTIPSQNGTLVYNGGVIIPFWTDFDDSKLIIGGVTEAIDAGEYIATFTPAHNYTWKDGSISPKNVTWKIDKAIVDIPSQNGTLVYNGSIQFPTWDNYNSNKLTINGTLSSLDAGIFDVTFVPTSNYIWSDGTSGIKRTTWEIDREVVGIPKLQNTLTYNGSNQSPTWDTYDPNKMKYFGTDYAVTAGQYTISFALYNNYKWDDDTTDVKEITWSIDKSPAYLITSNDSVEIINIDEPYILSFATNSTGSVSIKNEDPSIINYTIEGNNIIINGIKDGVSKLTITVNEDVNYTSINKVCDVSVVLPKELNDYTWEEISKISLNGNASSYFSIGDKKMISINGNIGPLNMDDNVYVYIIGFNHDNNNSIDFGTFKTINDVNIGLYSKSKTATNISFSMYHWGTSCYGGWKGSDLRYDILGSTDISPDNYGTASVTDRKGYDASNTCATNPVPNTLMSALPSDLRAVMKPMTIYTDNTGNIGIYYNRTTYNTPSDVTSSIDYLPLLSEFEIYGGISFSNIGEMKYQTQYEYFKLGNSKMKYIYNDINNSSFVYTRSTDNISAGFICVNKTTTEEAVGDIIANEPYIISPIFRI